MTILTTGPRRGLAALAAAGALVGVLGTAGPALAAGGAATTPAATGRPGAAAATLPGVKARAAAAIAVRQKDLSARLTMINSSPQLTAGDRQALGSLVTTDQSGLTALGAKIAADTDLATAQADYHRIFTDYRVFALAMPQVRLVRASDTVQTVVLPKLADARTTLQQALASHGKTDQAAALMADLSAQIAALQASTDGLSAKILALTPAGFNADHAVLQSPRQALVSARQDVRKARADIVAVRKLLQA
jgi:hypothetical protein